MAIEHGYPLARPRVEIPSPTRGPYFPGPPAGERASGAHSLTAAAGEFPHIQLFNAAGSTVWLFLEYIIIGSDATVTYQTFRGSTPLSGLARRWKLLGENPHDGRGEIRAQSAAALGGAETARYRLAAGAAQAPIPINALLRPGQGLHVQGGTAAGTMHVTFAGWEYPAP